MHSPVSLSGTREGLPGSQDWSLRRPSGPRPLAALGLTEPLCQACRSRGVSAPSSFHKEQARAPAPAGTGARSFMVAVVCSEDGPGRKDPSLPRAGPGATDLPQTNPIADVGSARVPGCPGLGRAPPSAARVWQGHRLVCVKLCLYACVWCTDVIISDTRQPRLQTNGSGAQAQTPPVSPCD